MISKDLINEHHRFFRGLAAAPSGISQRLLQIG